MHILESIAQMAEATPRLQMFPARDGLVRLLSRRDEPLSTGAFFMVDPSHAHARGLQFVITSLAGTIQVTYGITFGVYLVSVVTPSIWGPIQIIGATAGAVIGFLIPGKSGILQFSVPIAAKSRKAPALDRGLSGAKI